MRFSVAVHIMFVSLQIAGRVETFVAQQRTLVWLVSCVDSHVSVQAARLTKCLVARGTFIWLISSVDSHVSG